MEVTHLFVLILILGKSPVNDPPMHFYDINRCNYFASEIVKRFGNYKYYRNVPEDHRATAYCKQVLVNPKNVKVYQ